MKDATRRRVSRLEAERAPAVRIVVTFPGDPEPESLPPGVAHFAVEFVEAPEQDYRVTYTPPREAAEEPESAPQ